MLNNILALLSICPAAVVGVVSGDFFQFLYKPDRDTVFWVLQNRRWLTGLSLLLLVASGLFYLLNGSGHPLVFLGSAGADIFLLVSGLLMAPHLLFPKLTDPDWISADRADSLLDGEDLILGTEVKGRARAYPLDWTFRPHIVEDSVEGEEVTMSYCGLSNLAVAFDGRPGGKRMDVEMPIQYENNMMMYDSCTGGLIQQAEATMRNTDGSQVPLKQYPTRIMTWAAWRELYPESEVLHNPPSGLWDRLVRYVVGEWFMRPQWRIKTPIFPTVDEIDSRLETKQQVLGVTDGDQSRAYTLDYLDQQRVLNDTIGSEPILLVGDSDRGIYDIFYRTVEGEALEFREVGDQDRGLKIEDQQTGSRWTLRGEAVSGPMSGKRIEPYPHANRVLWFVWANFHPDTEVVTRSSDVESQSSTTMTKE